MQSVWAEQFVGKDVGNYHIDCLLGWGPVSSFYEAHHICGQSAILTLFNLPETFSQQAHRRFLARFRQEGETLVQLKHPAILPVYDYGEYAGCSYLAMSFVPGNSLAQVLRVRGSLPYELVLVVLKQVAEGLDYAHSNGVMHGMLSPANILIGKEYGKVQIVGFGLGRILALKGLEPQVPRLAHQLNLTGTFLGLPEYMAPESVLGESCKASADIFALGVLLYELLSGKPPFTGEAPFDVAEQYLLLPIPSLSALVPTLPASIDAVVRKALAYSAEQRFQSAGELVDAFEQVVHAQQADVQLPLTNLAQNATEKTTITDSLATNQQARGSATTGKQSDTLIRILQAAIPGLDPFAWWANASMTQIVSRPQTDKLVFGGVQRVGGRKLSRRQSVALLSVGVVVAAGLGSGGFALEYFLQMRKKVVLPVSYLRLFAWLVKKL